VCPKRFEDMKTWMLSLTTGVAAAAVAVGLALTPLHADAKRLGGGKNAGMQRDMPARTAPDAPPAKPATPAQQSPTPAGAAAPATAGAAAAAAAPAKRSWMGPIAGLAAGLGLVALFSALGMGEAVANFFMIALMVLLAVVVIGFLVRRFAGNSALKSPLPAGAGTPAGAAQGSGGQVAWPASSGSTAAPAAEPVAAAQEAPRAVPKAFVPAAFDSESFQRVAKMIFIRMQAANDAADLNDLRSFTTPELYASLALDVQERGRAAQRTEVLSVNAEVLDVAEEADRQIVSVRFTGDVRESAEASAEAFSEVWHLVKARSDGAQWAVAGIEQLS
jgi:predicted lipid-binding transport protein (Tim44 family)